MTCTVPRRWDGGSALLTATLLVLGTVSASSAQGCFTKPHREMTVNVRVAMAITTTAMRATYAPSELHCLRACCAKDTKDFFCNLAIFKPNKPQGPENCYLFHCMREKDCPLLAMGGVNTFNIFRDRLAPPTIGPVYPDNPSPTVGREANALGPVKGVLVAVVVVGLVVLTFLVALVGKKAAHSLSHRQYTRLELDNLKYEF
ncbi:hypothetical protein AAFF_G00314480 [Aldrovandia affinis]|uniref:MANSC domain-containing protein n=1 Tax=Aldrovandia affinis TaxID=143900 RepID=A0AAD7W0Z6_9TELE|nr:hypothetical protein AAFF_G00314480 [Aldrovandia affinis]